MYSRCLLATFFHLGIDTMSWTWAHIFFLFFSYALFLVIGLVSNALPSTGQNEYMIMEYLFSDLWSWLTVLMVAFLSVLPRFIIKVLANTFSPSAQYFYRKKHYQSNRQMLIYLTSSVAHFFKRLSFLFCSFFNPA